jgi:hypothetical protein
MNDRVASNPDHKKTQRHMPEPAASLVAVLHSVHTNHPTGDLALAAGPLW